MKSVPLVFTTRLLRLMVELEFAVRSWLAPTVEVEKVSVPSPGVKLPPPRMSNIPPTVMLFAPPPMTVPLAEMFPSEVKLWPDVVNVALVFTMRLATVAGPVNAVDVAVGMMAVLVAPGVNPQSQLPPVLKLVLTAPVNVQVAACEALALTMKPRIAAQAAMAIASDRDAPRVS